MTAACCIAASGLNKIAPSSESNAAVQNEEEVSHRHASDSDPITETDAKHALRLVARITMVRLVSGAARRQPALDAIQSDTKVDIREQQ
jgi:hypothetical protein